MRALLLLLLAGSAQAGIISGGGPTDALSAATAAGTYVQKAGDTMTGRLTAPDATLTYGLTVGTISASGSVDAGSVTIKGASCYGVSQTYNGCLSLGDTPAFRGYASFDAATDSIARFSLDNSYNNAASQVTLGFGPGNRPFTLLGSGAASFSGSVTASSVTTSGDARFNGDVGIGIAPSYPLHIYSAAPPYGFSALFHVANGQHNGIDFSEAFGGEVGLMKRSGTTDLWVSMDGGTTANHKFATNLLTTPGITATYGISAATAAFSSGITASSVTTSGDARFGGNVGIGADPGAYPFRLKATTDVNLRVTHDGAGNLRLGAGTDASTWDANMEIRNAKTTFATGNVIVDAGSVGIGTTAPAAKLHVSSGTTSVLIDGNGAIPFQIGTSSLAYLSGGFLGLGTASPTSMLDLNTTLLAVPNTQGIRLRGANGTLPSIIVGMTNVGSADWAMTNVGGDYRLDMGAGSNAIYVDNATQDTHFGTATGTQLYYCAGGTYDGHVGRGSGMVCTGGTATAMEVWVK